MCRFTSVVQPLRAGSRATIRQRGVLPLLRTPPGYSRIVVEKHVRSEAGLQSPPSMLQSSRDRKWSVAASPRGSLSVESARHVAYQLQIDEKYDKDDSDRRGSRGSVH